MKIYIKWKQLLGSSSDATCRIGEDETVTGSWIFLTDSKATFFPSDTASFLEKLGANDRFVAQITPAGANPTTAVFDITGSDGMVPHIADCGGAG